MLGCPPPLYANSYKGRVQVRKVVRPPFHFNFNIIWERECWELLCYPTLNVQHGLPVMNWIGHTVETRQITNERRRATRTQSYNVFLWLIAVVNVSHLLQFVWIKRCNFSTVNDNLYNFDTTRIETEYTAAKWFLLFVLRKCPVVYILASWQPPQNKIIHKQTVRDGFVKMQKYVENVEVCIALTPLTASWKWTEETFWGLQSYALGTVYSHKMSSWLQFSAGLSVEKYIYTACISILCSIKLSGFLPLDMFQFKTYNYQHSWVSEKMCFVKCKSHNGLHKKMNTMSFLAHGLVSECSEESNVEASPDTVTVGCLTFFLWLCKTFGIEWPWQSPRPKFYPVDCCV